MRATTAGGFWVPDWPPSRQRRSAVAETAQHAGHAEILREGLDGQGGRDADSFGDNDTWTAYIARIHEAAHPFRTHA